MNKKPYSLRLQLLAMIGLPVIIAGIIIGGFALSVTYAQIDAVFDSQLAQNAEILMQLTKHEILEHDPEGIDLQIEQPDFPHAYDKALFFRIWKGGHLVTQAYDTKMFGDKQVPEGFSTRSVKGASWRFFSFSDKKDKVTVEVSENNDARTDLIFQLLRSFFIPALIFVPAIFTFVWIGTTRALRPMTLLALEINQRGAQDLTPLKKEKIPQEVIPFIKALNQLFRRVDDGLRREREFTDNAAHELRTPLAAMKTQAQVMAREAGQSPERRESLHNLLYSIDRATRMVEQLLTFARLENMSEPMEAVNFSALIEEVLGDIYSQVQAKKQELIVEIEADLKLQGYPEALKVLVRNIVDNAIKYAPEGGRIVIAAMRQGAGSMFSVADNGEGIPEDQQAKVFDRFYRVNKSKGMGSGLGLSIARWIAGMHGATIELENARPHGLVVKIIFS